MVSTTQTNSDFVVDAEVPSPSKLYTTAEDDIEDLGVLSTLSPDEELRPAPRRRLGDLEVDEEHTPEYEEDPEDEDKAEIAPRLSDAKIRRMYLWKNHVAGSNKRPTKGTARKNLEMTGNDLLSTKEILEKKESTAIISDPREYQMELFERAKKENVIAVLDTGSGKTLIAVLLLRYCIDAELEHRAKGRHRRLSFFLVDSVVLVYQQFAVIKCNLDQKIDRFSGDMQTDAWDKTTWAIHLRDNMAIVCTAEILYQCLINSFITMRQINLLVFDEAHHTKKNHVYAKIIKEFYIPEPLVTRPKIFGMTASPVDSKDDPLGAAVKLEALLHSRIATAANLELLRNSVSRPEEKVVGYAALPRPYKTLFCQEMHQQFGDVHVLQPIFKKSEEIASDLGEWAADYLWKIAFEEEGSERLKRKTELIFATGNGSQKIETLDREISQIKEAQAVVAAHNVVCPTAVGGRISSKVRVLKETLDEIFPIKNKTRCIIFVTRRYNARLLAALLHEFGNKFLRLGVLIGTRKGEGGDMQSTVRDQILTIMGFRDGKINCLLATSIAEQGLDIPDCNCVIRFDLYDTVIQFIQSRGRARHKDSIFISMLENGNPAHKEVIAKAQAGERVMREFCKALPEDRLLKGNDQDLEDALFEEKHYPVYVEPVTGAKLTFGSVLGKIDYFVSTLPSEDESTPRAQYHMSHSGDAFIAEVILPTGTPIQSVIGKPFPRKALAKRSAAFEACLELRRNHYLNDHLLPVFHKQRPAMANAIVALNSKKHVQYGMLTKPSFWKKDWDITEPRTLYVTVFDLEDPNVLGRRFVPMAMLTKRQLIVVPPFPLHPRPSKISTVISTRLNIPLEVSNSDLKVFDSFTLRFFYDLFNKEYKADWGKTPYWLAPIRQQTEVSGTDLPREIIDWKVLKAVHENTIFEMKDGVLRLSQENTGFKWNVNTPDSDLIDYFWLDRWDGSRRFFSLEIDQTLTAADPVPEGCVTNSKWHKDILDHSWSMFKKAREKGIQEGWANWDPNQPVLKVQQIDIRRNFLDEWPNARDEVKVTYVCPQPMTRSPIPTTVVAFGYMLPAIVHRLDSYLIAQEACDMIGLEGILPDLALEAVTKDSDDSDEHKAEQIHFQRGMGKNYERLEFIGDAFLKMATSISLYAKNAQDNEFESHVKRMVMLCNKNLFENAKALELFAYIRSKGFQRGHWYPEHLVLLSGKKRPVGKPANDLPDSHGLADKTIADVCEALIGASLLSYKESGNMDMAVRAVTKFANNSDHAVDCFSEYRKMYTVPAWQSAASSASQNDLTDQVAIKYGYRFKWPRLLRAAFTHPSVPFIWEQIPCYQRLEFLGDSLLDMVCINHLFFRYPDKDPQWLTEHKMAMVSNKFLGALCVRLGFHPHMRHGSQKLSFQIKDYVTEITEAEAGSEGRKDYWTVVNNPPKCLPDIVEAYLGALFVDSDFDFDKITKFFYQHIEWYFTDMAIYDTYANAHPTTRLTNLVSVGYACSALSFHTEPLPYTGLPGEVQEIMAGVMVHDKVVADSIGTSNRYSKDRASAKAFNILSHMKHRRDFVEKYDCDCNPDYESDSGVESLTEFHDRVGATGANASAASKPLTKDFEATVEP